MSERAAQDAGPHHPGSYLDGQYYDGRTAARHAVTVWLRGASLCIEDAARAEERAHWSYAGLRLCEEVHAGGPARLRHAEAGDARLVVEAACFAALIERAPQLRRRRVARPLGLRIGAALGVLGLLAGGLVLGVPRLAGPLARALPLAWERALGAQVAAGMEAQTCHQPAGEAALAVLVQRLAAHAHSPLAFTVRVLQDPDRPVLNAFAAPGGQILIYRGLLDFTHSPDELAGVLGHEMAHVRHRHPTAGLIRALGLRLAASALFGDLGSIGATAGGLGASLLDLSYGRDAEREADAGAVNILQEAGYDSRGLARFFERLAADKEAPGTALPALLSTHPLTAERIAQLRRSGRSGAAPLSPRQWEALQAICGPPATGDGGPASAPARTNSSDGAGT